jgi:hypothetical protein
VTLEKQEEAHLQGFLLMPTVASYRKQRAVAVLLMHQGMTNIEIARLTGYTNQYASRLRSAFLKKRLAVLLPKKPGRRLQEGVEEAPHRGRGVLGKEELRELRRLLARRSVPPYVRRRAKAVLLIHKGLKSVEIARRTGYTIGYLARLRSVFLKKGLAILQLRKAGRRLL